MAGIPDSIKVPGEFKFVPETIKQETVEGTLAQRGTRYGKFVGHAEVAQAIKAAMSTGRNWPVLKADAVEALEMIAHKIARILNGDPDYDDSWRDIAGYAKLVEDRINGKVQ